MSKEKLLTYEELKARTLANAIKAFNEGYQLGVEHANREFGGNKNEN